MLAFRNLKGRGFTSLMAGWLALASAPADSIAPTFSPNAGDAVEVAYAIFGGVNKDRTAPTYVNVTARVAALLGQSPAGFPVTEVTLLGRRNADLVPSLIVLYSCRGENYFCNIPDGDGSLSLARLIDWSKTHRSFRISPAVPTGDDNGMKVVFSAYGVGDMFINSTDPIRSLLRNQPNGFAVTDEGMGGDPHPSWTKVLLVIFDDATGRHLYALFNSREPQVSQDDLIASRTN